MTDPRVVEAVVQAVLAQLRVDESSCSCHAVAAGCCPDRLGRLLGHGAERFGLQAGTNLYPRDIARKIDHTLLKPEATREQIETLCREAREHGFATVCVNPAWVRLCAALLRGSETRVCTVVGFPLGATVPEVKAFEAARVVEATTAAPEWTRAAPVAPGATSIPLRHWEKWCGRILTRASTSMPRTTRAWW